VKLAASVKLETIREVSTALAADDMQGRGKPNPVATRRHIHRGPLCQTGT